jgi:Superinfection immunity protein
MPTDPVALGLLAAVLAFLAFFLYFAPGITASRRGKQDWVAILALNLLLGWTLIGWTIALVGAR